MKKVANPFLAIFLTICLACLVVVTCCFGVIENKIYFALIMVFLCVMPALLFFSFVKKMESFFRICCIISGYFIVFFAIFTTLKLTGVIDNFSDISALQEFVANTGNAGVFVFFGIMLLQVLIIPIPAVITIMAGSLLFGPTTAFLICTTGILLGSITAFILGRTLGKKILRWIDREGVANKYLAILEKCGGIVLFLMFLLPLFPDDLLCVIAGLSNIKPKDFILVSLVARTIGIAFITYFGSGSIFSSMWAKVLCYTLVAILGLVLVICVNKVKKRIED